jgi:hypothetical protein
MIWRRKLVFSSFYIEMVQPQFFGARKKMAARAEIELELGLIQTQMTQNPMPRAEGGCACVAQMARAKIRGRG